MKHQSVHFLWNEPEITTGFASAVSLHSHTDRSREGLYDAPRYAKANALVGLAVARISARYRKLVGQDLDFRNAYFVPPLGPVESYRVEATQIQAMGLNPIVSITDHDTIEGPAQLQSLIEPERVPVSLEWTVPFGPSYFHVGVHNLPPQLAAGIAFELCEIRCSHCLMSRVSCVDNHDARCFPGVADRLERLASMPGTLIVVNHPLWDVRGIGERAHRDLLALFLSRYGEWLDALELNGLRSWEENRDVMEVSRQNHLAVISGGDRHGFEPNAVVNLTKAETFSEFAEEIRADRTSVVVFLKQYQQPLTLRVLRVAWDILKSSTAPNGDRKRWTDRIFLPWIDGRVLALSSQEWSGTLANKPIKGPQPSECLACDAAHGSEY